MPSYAPDGSSDEFDGQMSVEPKRGAIGLWEKVGEDGKTDSHRRIAELEAALHEARAAEFDCDGVVEDLKSATAMIRNLATGITSPAAAAWWMAANYRTDVASDWPLRRLAESHGAPPKGATWNDWFNR